MDSLTLRSLLLQIQVNGVGESFLLPMILNMSLTASVIIAAVLLVRLVLRRAPKIFSYALWAVVLFRLLCPVSLSSAFSLLGLLDTPAQESGPYTTAVEYVPFDMAHTPELEVQLPAPPAVNDAVDEALPQEHAALGADPMEGVLAIATLVWLAGILVMAVYSVVSLIRLRRSLVGAVPLERNVWLADHISTPFVLGLLRPKIYLPSSLPEQERSYILLHERHHIRRLDHLVKLLAFLALCIHWFNPLVWLAFALLGRDMEMSCDEAVLKKLGEDVRADYSASLLRLATGRRIIAGAPLAFGEGDTKSRVKNVLRWRRPRLGLVVLTAAACVAVIAACAANPRGTDSSSAGQRGQYASMEDFAREAMSAETVTYHTVGGSVAAARVTDRRIAQLHKEGEVEGLDPDGVLEAWTFRYEIQVDVPAEEISLTGGMYETDGWYDLDGQGGRNIVALRFPDGSYDILYDAAVNDNMGFYNYHHSYEEAIYDWYVTENQLDFPLYVEDWAEDIHSDNPAYSGNFPVHRFDGDGWYLYIPTAAWDRVAVNPDFAGDQWQWTSAYGTGSALTVDFFSTSLADQQTVSRAQGYTPADGGSGQIWENRQGSSVSRYCFHANPAGGCWRVWTQWTDGGAHDSSAASTEPWVLQRMAESFVLDARTTASSESGAAQLSAALDSVQEGDPVGLLLVENGGETAYDNCWFGGSTSGFLRALQALTWSRVPAPADPESENTVTLYAPNDWSLTAYADSDPVVRFQGPTGTWWLTGSGADPRQTPYQLLRDWGSSLWFNWAQAYTEARGEYLLSCFGLQAGDFSFAWDFNVSTYVGMDVYTWMADTMDLPSGATSPAYFVAPDLSVIYCVYQDPDAVNHLYCFVPEQEGAIQEYGGYTWMLQEVRTMQDTDRYVNTHQSMAEFMASWAPTAPGSPPR